MHIIDLIENVVESVRDTGIIDSIVDNGNGTYNVLTTEIVETGQWLTISNTPNFNNQYKVQSVGIGYFVISETAGKIISTFGTFAANKPYYEPAKFKELATYLTTKNYSKIQREQKFPLILLRLNLGDENANQLTNQCTISGLTIFIIGATQITSSSRFRHENEMPILRQVEKKFMFELMKNKRVHSDVTTYGREELFNVSPANVNILTNAVMITLSNFKYDTKEC